MRIEFTASAREHGITDDEMRTVLAYPALTVPLTPRRPGTQPVLYIGPAADNEPYIEVIADHADPTAQVVFHAMMRRFQLVRSLGIDSLVPSARYGPQRSEDTS